MITRSLERFENLCRYQFAGTSRKPAPRRTSNVGSNEMAACEYKYSGKTWKPRPTHSDGNCFFHALFGEKTELDGNAFYFDKHTAFRRLYWAAFLVFFQQVEIPEALLEIIQKCFVASDSFVNKSPGNPEDFNDYIRNVALGQYWVLVEEVPIISTLWNVRVVLFLGEQEVPQIFEPNPQIYGTFPFASIMPLREQVIRLTEHHFERLSVVVEPNAHIVDNIEPEISYYEEESDEELEDSVYKHRKHYKKGGSAGVQGGLYQINLITLILLNALKKCKTWLLSTENEAAGKFDDLILESPEGDLLIQAKHKEGKNKIINYDALLSTTPSPFSLAKYFVSFQQIRTKFKVSNIVICTNADLQTDKSMEGLVEPHEVTKDSVLHFEGASNTFYTFNDGMVGKLRESVTKYFSQNMPSNKVCVSDEGIKEFLTYLQFFPNYMNEERLDDIVNTLIRSLRLTRDLDSTDTFKDIHSVMLEWFKNVNGQYLSKLDAKAILCDIRTTRYCQSFETYDITFKNDSRHGLKRMLHVIPSGELILSVIKLYQVLQGEEKGKVLFLNPNDSVSVQKQVVDCFTHPRYTFLVITSPAWTNDEVTHKISKKILKILDSRKYKKLVLVAEAENKLARCMKSYFNDYEEIKEEIRFQDLTEEAQTTLKRKKNIVFQGTVMTLEQLVAEDLDCFIDSDILDKLAKNTAIEIGSKPVHADENINNYYIYRTLKRNDKDVPEEKFRLLKDFPERIVLISDSAGMGKSTILTNLAVKIKENYPFLWVIRIDLNNQSTAFKDAAKKRLKSISVVDLLNVHEATKLKGDFSRKLFLKPDNVVLMLDAVDEVSSAYMELVMGMMVEAKLERNFAKIFVTTRPHLCEMLQHTLEVAAFTLEPFSKEDQVDFLTKYWTQRLDLKGVEERKRCQQYAEALINEMSRWIDEGAENTFAGIPLQTRMLAEVFQERNQQMEVEPKQWEECKEFLSSGKDKPHLPKKINLIELYELFVAKKRDIFVDIKGNTGGNPISEGALKDKFEECHKFHRNLALRIMFYFHECEIFGSYKDWTEFTRAFVDNYVLRAGIVQEVDGKVNFIHRTFAEYFAAECLVLDLRKGLFTKKFQELLLEEVLIREEFFVVRAFFDSFVQKELPFIPNNTLTAFSESDYLSILDHRRKSYLHLLAQEGSIGTMKFFFACSNSRMTEDNETLEEVKGTFVDATDMELNTPLHVACSRGHLNVVMALVERGANINFENVNEETPLHLAALGGHLDVVEYLVDKAGADLNKVNSYGESALLLAARKGNLKIIKFLIKRGMKYTGIYTTALHIASSEGNLTIVKYLVERVHADVDILDVDNCAPLHDASHEGHLNVVKYLVRCGSNVNATNRDLNTAFHTTALKGYVHLVTFFIENGADTAIANRYGYTIMDLIEWLRSQISENDTESNDSGEGSDIESGHCEEEIKNNKSQNDGNSKETSKNDNEEGECGASNGNNENDIVDSKKKDEDK